MTDDAKAVAVVFALRGIHAFFTGGSWWIGDEHGGHRWTPTGQYMHQSVHNLAERLDWAATAKTWDFDRYGENWAEQTIPAWFTANPE